MRCIHSSVSQVQTTRLAIKSFCREMETVEKCFEDGLRIIGTTEDTDKLNFPSIICRLRQLHPPRKFCNVCRRTENVGQAIFEAHESALCTSLH